MKYSILSGHPLVGPEENVPLMTCALGGLASVGTPTQQRPGGGWDTPEALGACIYELLGAQSILWGVGKASLPAPGWKEGWREGVGAGSHPCPGPGQEGVGLPRSPSHLSATWKPNYSRLMSARQGPATRCCWILAPRGLVTSARTGPWPLYPALANIAPSSCKGWQGLLKHCDMAWAGAK